MEEQAAAASKLEQAALAYAAQGMHVFPLAPHGKTPLTAHGLEDATTDPMTIETWWSRWPSANIGIRTGDLVVVDEDELGHFDTVAKEAGWKIPETRVAKTAKGRHFYFTQPEGQRVRNTAGKLAAGIDTRGDGGYVVAPPSIHPSGAVYDWLATVEPVKMPDWIASRLVRQQPERQPLPDIPLFGTTPYGERALKDEIANVANAPEGTRNDTLNTAAFALGQLVGGREIDQSDAWRSLEAAASHCGLPPTEVRKTLTSGFQAGLENPRSAPESSVQPRPDLRVVREPEPKQPVAGAMFPVEPYPTFRENADVQFDFLVEDLWPVQSLGFIASEPKKGKTWLGLSLALSVAAGKMFLGQFVVQKPRNVLYLALEGQRKALNDRIGSLARGHQIDPESDELSGLILSYRPRGLDLADKGWASELAAVANENNVELVIVDVLRNAARIKENDASEFAHFRILLEDTLRISSVALLHHFTKLSEISKERTPAERMSGSGAMFGALDVGMFITGSDDHARRLKISFDGRDIAMPDPISVYLEGDGTGPNRGLTFSDTAFWSYDIEDVQEDNVIAPPSAVVAWVRQQGGDVLMTDATAHFKTTDDTMRKRKPSLQAMGLKWESVREGKVNRVHLIDPEMIGEGVQEAADFTPEFTTEPNLPSGANTAETSGFDSRTDAPESHPLGSEESAHLQGDLHTRRTRPSTKVDPPPSGQSTVEAEAASEDIPLP